MQRWRPRKRVTRTVIFWNKTTPFNRIINVKSKKGRGKEDKKSGLTFWNNSRHFHFHFHHCYLNLKQTKNTEWNFHNVIKNIHEPFQFYKLWKKQVWNVSNNRQLDTFNIYTYLHICLTSEWPLMWKLKIDEILLFSYKLWEKKFKMFQTIVTSIHLIYIHIDTTFVWHRND